MMSSLYLDEEEYVNKNNEAFLKSERSRVADITLMGDRNTIVQVVSLLSYIRSAIKEGTKKTITVKIGNNITNGDFEFLLNNSKCDDAVVKDEIEIN